MSEVCPLIVKSSYVYNPTDEWFTCTVSHEEQYFRIKVLPPRSCRNFPITFLEPKINSFSKISATSHVLRSSSSLERLTEPPLKLKIITTFHGTIELENEIPSINPIISINNDVINGWYSLGQHLFFMTGNIIPKAHEVHISIYGSNGAKYKNLTGKVRSADKKINIEASAGKLQISLIASEDEKIIPKEDVSLSGSYMAFQERENSQDDLYLTVHAASDGLVNAEVIDGKNKYILNGCRNETSLFLISISNGEISFFGEIAKTDNDLSVTGNWHQGSQSGTFAFFKQSN